MARKPKLTAGKLVRQMARNQVGPVPPGRAIPDKRDHPDKHKIDLTRQAAQEKPE